MASPSPRPTILVAASGFIYAPRSSNNLGDRAQLTCTLDQLRRSLPDSRVVAVANSLNDRADVEDLPVSYRAITYLTSDVTVPGTSIRLPTRWTIRVRALLLLANASRVAARKRTRFLSSAGQEALAEMDAATALFLSGAGTFNDLYIRGVGGFWAVLIGCLSALGKPVVASGQQVGPVARPTSRMIVRWALRRIDFLGVRDPISLRVARSLCPGRPLIVLTGDDAWGLTPASSSAARTILARNGVTGEFIAAQIRFGYGWHRAEAQEFADLLARASSYFALPIVFVACATGLGEDDRSAAELVQRHLKSPSCIIRAELDAPMTKAVLGHATLAIGTANHFCVFAASMGTPVIGIHASPYMEQKLVGLAELWSDRVVALSKTFGLNSAAVLASARDILAAQAGKDERTPEAQLCDATRFLQRFMDGAGMPPYGARFKDDGAVTTYEWEFRAGSFMWNLSGLESRILRSAVESRHTIPFKRHLDFACGTGRAIGFLDGLSEETVGVDISEAMLQKAGRQFPRTRFLRGDVFENPNLLDEVGPCDLVTLWRFVAPAEPELRRAALTAIAACMDEGGLLVVNNNANRTSLLGLALRLRARVKGIPFRPEPYRGAISHRELCHLLESIGLLVEETRAIAYLPEHVSRRLPSVLWMPFERIMARLNLAPAYAANQLVIARRPRDQ
jgi:polysaccharide pyruvyl transferase WcaK-like protein/SAM-dependent methyltransferase